MTTQSPATQPERSQRRALQLIFIFINLVLIEVHLPGPLWIAVGGVFWLTMILLAAVGGSWMCGWVCWIGGIQDLMEPLARSRIRLNATWGRGITLFVLVAWVPVLWWLVPGAGTQAYTPFNADFTAWPQRLFQLGLMLLVGASVMLLGKRGICRYLCPFNSVVAVVRRRLPTRQASTAAPEACASGCRSCAHACKPVAAQPVARWETIPLVAERKNQASVSEQEKPA